LEVLGGFSQVFGEEFDFFFLEVFGCEVVYVVLDGVHGLDFFLHAFEAGFKEDDGCQVGVAAGVGVSVFYSGDLVGVPWCEGDSDEGASVGVSPGDVYGGLVVGY